MSLWASVIKRHYLLKMKAKYAGKVLVILWVNEHVCTCVDGQKIAKKLSCGIVKKMNVILQE